MEIIFSQKSFEENLYYFSLLFNILNIDAKNYFSIIVDSDYWFAIENKTAIEVKEFKDKHKKTNLDILLNFINNIKSNIHNLEDKNKKENVNEIDLIKRIEMIEKEIKDINIRQTKSNNAHREELNGLKKEIDTLKKEQIEMKQNYDFNENKIFIQLKKQEDKIDQLKMATKIMNEKMKKIENEFDTIKARKKFQNQYKFITI